MFENLDMNALMQQAQQMQAELMAKQAEIAAQEFEGKAGGELVRVKVSGSGDIVELDIKPEAWDPDDTETLSALVIAAFRAAKSQADAALQAQMPQMPTMPEGLGF